MWCEFFGLKVYLCDVQAFNSMIDRKMAASPVDGLIVYPEGDLPSIFRLCTFKSPFSPIFGNYLRHLLMCRTP